MEKMLTEENFILAERKLSLNKRKDKLARYISQHAEYYGPKLLKEVKSGYSWHAPRCTTIKDSYKGKERNLKIPCKKDQAVQIAWLNIATPYIEQKNYYYNCGSIPGAGQTRCTKALKKWLKDPKAKYGAVLDIRKFYDTCPHDLVRKGLYRIFKDKDFVEFAMSFTASMSDNDIGLAIGYPVSHWLANIALMQLDHDIKRLYPDVHYVRYMDDMALVSSNKRHIRKCIYFIKGSIESSGMTLKKWSVFKIKDRGLTFLSFRFFNGYTLMTKKLMVRISRRMHKSVHKMNKHIAMGLVSYFGILSQCNSYNFRVRHVYPYTSKPYLTTIISQMS